MSTVMPRFAPGARRILLVALGVTAVGISLQAFLAGFAILVQFGRWFPTLR